jgi:hypothetical protein
MQCNTVRRTHRWRQLSSIENTTSGFSAPARYRWAATIVRLWQHSVSPEAAAPSSLAASLQSGGMGGQGRDAVSR